MLFLGQKKSVSFLFVPVCSVFQRSFTLFFFAHVDSHIFQLFPGVLLVNLESLSFFSVGCFWLDWLCPLAISFSQACMYFVSTWPCLCEVKLLTCVWVASRRVIVRRITAYFSGGISVFFGCFCVDLISVPINVYSLFSIQDYILLSVDVTCVESVHVGNKSVWINSCLDFCWLHWWCFNFWCKDSVAGLNERWFTCPFCLLHAQAGDVPTVFPWLRMLPKVRVYRPMWPIWILYLIIMVCMYTALSRSYSADKTVILQDFNSS